MAAFTGSIETGSDSRLVRIVVAVAAALVALGLDFALDEFAGSRPWYLGFVPFVVFSAWYGGLKPGLVTTAILSVSAWWQAPGNIPDEPLRRVLFLIASVAVCSAMQRVRAERFRAKIAERGLHSVLESTRDAIIAVDFDLCITYANKSAAKIARKSPQEMKGKSLRTVFPETPKVVLYRELNRAMREKVHIRVEDGLEHTVQWFQFNAYPVNAGLNLFIADITAQKKSQIERVRQQYEGPHEQVRAEAALQSLPVGVVIASADLRVELANVAAMEIFGTALKPGDRFPDVCPGFLRGPSGEVRMPEGWPVAIAARTGVPLSNQEAEYTAPGFGARTLIVNSVPLHARSGELRGVIGTYLDVTAIRRTEKTLSAAEARLRRLFETPAIGILAGDGEQVREANDAFLQMAGFTRAALEAGEIVWPAEPEHSEPLEKEYVRPDGEAITFLTGWAACEPESSWIAWTVDLSARRKLEARLRDAAKLESIGLLAGGVAHDFNNILTGVLGHASIALEMLHENARTSLETAISCAERAADLTRQLLAYAGKGRFVVGPMNLSRLTRDIARLIRTSVPRNVELTFHLAEDLPDVEADGAQIQQVIMNLAINAAESVGETGGVVRITTSAIDVDEAWIESAGLELAPGNYVSLEVQDTGCGMDEATVQRIFDPFFTTKFAGRGLGLAAAMGIARSHKGAIRVYSAPGTGSIFRVLLPAVEALIAEPVLAEAAQKPPRGTGTVLVVDDEEMVRRVARVALEKYGYTVVLASNGRQALEIFRGLSHSISMVLLDMTMPIMGGEETLRNLRALHPGVKVLMTSGFNEPETLRRAAESGFAGFIQKPYTAEALAARVHGILALDS